MKHSYGAFHGGPADGLGLTLPGGKAPFYVRVGVEPNVGECAVLSGTENAHDDEDVAVYVRPGEVLRQVVEPGGPAVVTVVSYVFVADVDGAEFRRAHDWQEWATHQPPAGQGRVGETTWPAPIAPDPVPT